jgi:hypothetical protein
MQRLESVRRARVDDPPAGGFQLRLQGVGLGEPAVGSRGAAGVGEAPDLVGGVWLGQGQVVGILAMAQVSLTAPGW